MQNEHVHMECTHGGSSEVGVQVPVGAERADSQAEEQGCDRCCYLSARGKVVLSCPATQKPHAYRQMTPHMQIQYTVLNTESEE